MEKHNHTHIIEQVPVDFYQKGVERNLLQRIWHTNKLRVVLSLIDFTPKKVLDVGCASGWFLSNIAKKFPKASYYGIDVYDKGIAHAKLLYPKMQFRVADAHAIPFPKETFDLIICTEVLEHVDDPREVLLEIRRVLAKNGKVIVELDSGSLLFSIAWYLWRKVYGRVWNDSHLHSFTAEKLEQVTTACGFAILEKRTFNFGMAISFLLGKENI